MAAPFRQNPHLDGDDETALLTLRTVLNDLQTTIAKGKGGHDETVELAQTSQVAELERDIQLLEDRLFALEFYRGDGFNTHARGHHPARQPTQDPVTYNYGNPANRGIFIPSHEDPSPPACFQARTTYHTPAANPDHGLASGASAAPGAPGPSGELEKTTSNDFESLFEDYFDPTIFESSSPIQPESSPWAASRQSSQSVNICVICEDLIPPTDVTTAACGHNYCRTCIVGLFTMSLVDATLFPPRCCNRIFPMPVIRVILPPELVEKYNTRKEEFEATKPIYCFDPACNVYIRPSNITADRATCSACSKVTCTVCRSQGHVGDCPCDEGIMKTEELAKSHGWQRCPKCSSMVSISYGCNHMICLCNFQFCYECANPWKTCHCPNASARNIFGYALEGGRANQGPDHNQGPHGPPLVPRLGRRPPEDEALLREGFLEHIRRDATAPRDNDRSTGRLGRGRPSIPPIRWLEDNEGPENNSSSSSDLPSSDGTPSRPPRRDRNTRDDSPSRHPRQDRNIPDDRPSRGFRQCGTNRRYWPLPPPTRQARDRPYVPALGHRNRQAPDPLLQSSASEGLSQDSVGVNNFHERLLPPPLPRQAGDGPYFSVSGGFSRLPNPSQTATETSQSRHSAVLAPGDRPSLLDSPVISRYLDPNQRTTESRHNRTSAVPAPSRGNPNQFFCVPRNNIVPQGGAPCQHDWEILGGGSLCGGCYTHAPGDISICRLCRLHRCGPCIYAERIERP